MALITTRSLSVDRRLQAVSVSIEAGEIIGLVGPNGAGKSTLLNTLAGLNPYKGDMTLDGQCYTQLRTTMRARLLGLQPQYTESAWSIRVRDVVALGRIPWGDENSEAINRAMHFTAVTEFADRPVDSLSGGERARVWLARVLAGEPKVLLVDEPVASLDIHYQLAVMDLLKQYASEGNAVVIALHDLGLAARYCDRLCLLDKGRQVITATAAEVLKNEILEPVYKVGVDVDLQRKPPVVLPK